MGICDLAIWRFIDFGDFGGCPETSLLAAIAHLRKDTPKRGTKKVARFFFANGPNKMCLSEDHDSGHSGSGLQDRKGNMEFNTI